VSAPDYLAERRHLARVAGLLYVRRLTELQGGNMSMRVGDAMIMTPTKASENTGWRLDAEDLLVQDLSGNVLVGDPAHVSREIRIHTRLYRAYADIGCVFHLHLAEAIAAAGVWPPGVVATSSEPYGAAVVVLESDLRAQTEAHDARATELLGQVSRAQGAVAIGAMHGTFGVARDVATGVRAADVLRQRLDSETLRGRLRRLRLEDQA
jgi:L-fuculose-phosphate aldolase